ncbi:ABC transporter substrate-binding protein [Natronospirillum operosum]|uniref:ABC transporter substrate-binding protein n=1 Tax=Natronospirillum operosum TaxID=2759953 RepID=A0A4Z0W9J6_9GAMM|nr:ABC transporter substrate-binding protein [Natronospirillum operosum]TGG93849.1 ABC transporter substrate-binding protein [Natronospirillum operosum]
MKASTSTELTAVQTPNNSHPATMGRLRSGLFGLVGALGLIAGQAFAEQTEYPLTIENNGVTLQFDGPPERAISLNGHTTELMLSLGLADRMVGTAYLNHPLLEHLEDDYADIPQLSGGTSYPSLEVVLGTDADFTYGRDSAYRDTAVATPERLLEMGINAYAVEGTLVTNATMDHVYQDIRNLGRIFDIQPRAEALIDEIETEIAAVQDAVADVDNTVRVFVYDMGESTAYTTGRALQTHLIELAGGYNVFGDLEETWQMVNWEEVVDRNPDVIVINDYGQTSAESKIRFLLENPALSDVAAIKNEHFVVLPLPAAFEGVRNPSAVRTLAEGFYPEAF